MQIKFFNFLLSKLGNNSRKKQQNTQLLNIPALCASYFSQSLTLS